MNSEPVRRVLDALGARYALIGAHAMAARGYLLLRDGTDVDIVVGKWKWEGRSCSSSPPAEPSTSRDAAAPLMIGDRDRVIREVEAHVDDVRPDVRAAWHELLTASDRGSA